MPLGYSPTQTTTHWLPVPLGTDNRNQNCLCVSSLSRFPSIILQSQSRGQVWLEVRKIDQPDCRVSSLPLFPTFFPTFCKKFLLFPTFAKNSYFLPKIPTFSYLFDLSFCWTPCDCANQPGCWKAQCNAERAVLSGNGQTSISAKNLGDSHLGVLFKVFLNGLRSTTAALNFPESTTCYLHQRIPMRRPSGDEKRAHKS